MISYDDLTPEQRKRVDRRQTPEELFALAKEEGVEIPEEDLEQIAGGGPWSMRPPCDRCGGKNVQEESTPDYVRYVCPDCGFSITMS